MCAGVSEKVKIDLLSLFFGCSAKSESELFTCISNVPTLKEK